MLSKKEAGEALTRKIRASALSSDDAKILGFEAFTQEEVATRPSFAGLTATPAAGFVIPYYTKDREYADFFRFRYLEQPPKNGLRALIHTKELRYIQPAKATPRAYFSPLFDWEDFFARPAKERWMIITEGELKASCGCKHGYPTLGLGGVWNFMSKREGLDLLPDLKELDVKDSVVYITYDSDAVTNPDVLMAENKLARQLLKLGAQPYVLRIPPLKTLPKVGLDDYLVARGKNSFEKLIERAEPWAPSAALHEMNEDVILIREDATVIELATRHRWTTSVFTSAAYADRSYIAKEFRKKEEVAVEKKTAAEWVKWPGRAAAQRVTYRPGFQEIADGEYNLWRGWGLKEEVVKKAPVPLWHQLLKFLFSQAEPEHRKWFEQWLAYPLQHPGAKLFQSVVMWGGPGVGKTLVAHTMQRIYGDNYTEVNERELHASFNGWAEGKQMACGEEITGGDKRAVADYLKGIITQKFIRINQKFIKPYTIPDCINWYFTSNHPDAFFIEDKDRRYFVNEVVGDPLPRAFYKEYSDWYLSDAGAGALFYHLLHLDLEGYDPSAPAPVTSSKREMIADVRSEVASWCATLRESPDEALRLPGGEPITRQLWTTRELFALHQGRFGETRLTENGLGRELKRAGFRRVLGGGVLRTRHGLVKLWSIRNCAELSKLKQPAKVAELYDKELGSIPEKKKEKF